MESDLSLSHAKLYLTSFKGLDWLTVLHDYWVLDFTVVHWVDLDHWGAPSDNSFMSLFDESVGSADESGDDFVFI